MSERIVKKQVKENVEHKAPKAAPKVAKVEADKAKPVHTKEDQKHDVKAKSHTPKESHKEHVSNKEDKVAKSQNAPVVEKAPKKKYVPKKGLVQVKAKRKMAIARAVIRSGKGRVTINKVPYNLISNKYLRDMISEPVLLLESYNKDMPSKIDVEVIVHGGGQVSQIVASRGCIAKGIVKFFDDPKIKELYNSYDRSMIVDDVRRKESKKQLGRGARSKWQHSKR